MSQGKLGQEELFLLRFTCIFLSLLACDSQLYSDNIKGAQAAFSTGISFEKSGDYVSAINSFEQSLALSPTYYWASKELGNCHYYLQNYAEAIIDYDRYISKNPADQNARNFLNSLRKKLNQGQTNVSVSKVSDQPVGNGGGSGFHADLFGNIIGIGSGDIKSFASDGNPGSVSGPDLLWDGALTAVLGYTFKNSITTGLGFSFGPMRNAMLSQRNDSNASATLNLNEWSIMGHGGWRYAFNRHAVSIELGSGPAFLNGNYDYKNQINSAANLNLSFSSFAWAFETQFEYEFRLKPRWGICLDFGYRLIDFSSIAVSGGTGQTGSSKYSDGTNVSFNDSGLKFSVGIRHFFGRM